MTTQDADSKVDNHEVTVANGQQHVLTLTLTEFRLLVLLVRVPNCVFILRAW